MIKVFVISVVDKDIWSGQVANFKPGSINSFFMKAGDFEITVNAVSHQEIVIL